MVTLPSLKRAARSSSLLGAALLLLMQAGCATPMLSHDDPLASFNRASHAFNTGLDQALVKPLAIGYQRYTPAMVRRSIGHFLDNLGAPATAATARTEYTAGAPGTALVLPRSAPLLCDRRSPCGSGGATAVGTIDASSCASSSRLVAAGAAVACGAGVAVGSAAGAHATASAVTSDRLRPINHPRCLFNIQFPSLLPKPPHSNVCEQPINPASQKIIHTQSVHVDLYPQPTSSAAIIYGEGHDCQLIFHESSVT